MSQKEFLKELKKLKKAAERLSEKQLCLNCLGRNFAQISTGLSNKKRGELILKFLKKPETENKTCVVCGNIFQKLPEYADKAIKQLSGVEFRTFLVGSKLPERIIKKEELIWEEFGIDFVESLKSEINREFGKIIEKKTGKKFNPDNPDVNILLNLKTGRTEFRINSVFIYGVYKKLIRGIPQTKWNKYKTSIENIIAKPFMKASKGSAHSLHCSGREDIDARCLDYRPFVLEIKEPKKRTFQLTKLREEIIKTKKIYVSKLSYSNKNKVREIKRSRNDKTYRVIIQLEKQAEHVEKLRTLVGLINQKTPSRVLHRRADLMRKRRVKSIKWKKITSKKLRLDIRGESGLYIKELVTGDKGRTKPSVAEILGPAKVISLDVIKIHT